MPASPMPTARGGARRLGFYRLLNRIPWPRSFIGRLLVLCIAAMSVPVAVSLGLVVVFLGPESVNRTALLGAALIGDLAGVCLLLIGLRHALEPVRLSAEALDVYQRDGRLPPLPGHYDDEPGRLMHAIGRTITSMESIHAELLHRAETDPLTEIANRRRFLRRAAEELDDACLSGTPLALVVLDIDRFKVINDTFGHAAGDEVLRTVAGLVGRTLRSRDAFARIGGEEFAILMPATTLPEAVLIAERLRHWIATLPLADIDGATVTASFGVTEADTGDRDITVVLHRADMALYDAKRGGRDCVAYRSLGDGQLEMAAMRKRLPAVSLAAPSGGGSDSVWLID